MFVKAEPNTLEYDRVALITVKTDSKTDYVVINQKGVQKPEPVYVPFDITNVIIMNTNGGTNSLSIINMEKDGLYASTLKYLSERIVFNIKKWGTYNMTRKWYFPDSTVPDRTDYYTMPFPYDYETPFIVSIYNNTWTPSYYKTGTHKWEYYYEGQLIFTKTFVVY